MAEQPIMMPWGLSGIIGLPHAVLCVPTLTPGNPEDSYYCPWQDGQVGTSIFGWNSEIYFWRVLVSQTKFVAVKFMLISIRLFGNEFFLYIQRGPLSPPGVLCGRQRVHQGAVGWWVHQPDSMEDLARERLCMDIYDIPGFQVKHAFVFFDISFVIRGTFHYDKNLNLVFFVTKAADIIRIGLS